MKNFKMHVQSKLLSKLAMTCLLIITASLLTFIGCAPEAMDPVAKKAGDGTPTPTPPALVGPIYIAVGGDGKIALSKDSGVSWEAVDSGITTRINLTDIATDGTNIVAVANNGVLVRSTDGGESWSIVSSTGISSSGSINIEYGNGVFSIFTYKAIAPHYEFHRSTDGGATWAKGTIASGLFTVATADNRFAYNGSRFLAVSGLDVPGSSTIDEGTIAVSTDGLNYTSGLGNGNVKFGNSSLSLRIANGRFFIFNALSTGYNTPNIYQSPTGDSQWTTNRRTSATDVTTFPAAVSDMRIKDVAHAGSGGVYAFVGGPTGVNIMTSPTAMAGSFTLQTTLETTSLLRIIFFKDKFVAAGNSGTIWNGDAMGTTWTAVTSGTTANLTRGEATANTIIFAGANGKIVVSSDGTTWEEKSAAGITTWYLSLLLIE